MPDAPSIVLTMPATPIAGITLSPTPSVGFQSVTAGVFSINDLQGYLRLSGAGSVYITQDGKTFVISGAATQGGDGGTGFVTEAQLAATGTVLNLKIDSLSGWAASAANLAATGSTLYNLIGSSAAGVITINGISGVVTLTGAGGVTVTRQGQGLIVSGDVSFSQLATSGAYLESLITGVSGYSAATYATKTQLAQTGVTLGAHIDTVASNLATTGSVLDNKINFLSGYLTGTTGIYATKAALESSGQQAIAMAIGVGTNLSGNLTQTGVSLGARIDTLINNLTLTGQTLRASITGVSGDLTQTGVTLGGQISTVTSNLTLTGQIFDSRTTSISGNLIQTGVTLGARIDTTGTAAFLYVNTVSGELKNQLTLSGQRLSALTVTGSSILNTADLNGIKGVTVIRSGDSNVFISGNSDQLTQTGITLLALIQGASAGVSTLNGASGIVTLVGAGNVVVTTVGQTITVSGNTGAYAGFASKIELTATGGLLTALRVTGSSILNNAILTGLGGTLVLHSGNYVFISGAAQGGGGVSAAQLEATGQAAWTAADNNGRNLSGALTASGQTLISLYTAADLSVSGALALKLTNSGVTLGNTIASTGQAAWAAAQNNAINLSGALTASGALLSAFKVTGSAVINNPDFTGIKGNEVIRSGLNIVLVSGNADQLTNTGVLLGGRIDTVTTNLTLTGQLLDARTSSLSGNLTTTGQTLWNATQNNATNLSGTLSASGQRLSAVTVTGSQILNTPDFTGIKGVTVSITGLNRVVVSGNSDHLTQTGIILLNLISAASAGVSSVNGASGVLTIAGAGNVFVTTSAQTITVSGDTGVYASFATRTELTNTGVLLGARIDTVANNLTLTGQILDARTTTLSANLTQTGVTLVAADLSVSGALALKLTSTGVVLGSRIDTVASNLTATGQIFDARTISLSGNLITTGQTLWNAAQNNATNLSGNLTASGATLIGLYTAADLALSGILGLRLTNTGQLLTAVTVTGSATLNNVDLRGLGGTIVYQSGTTVWISGGAGGGVTPLQLEATGQAAWTAADNNGRNISGALTASGALLSALKATGSSIINNPDFTGIKGNEVIRSGLNIILVSGNADQLTNTGVLLGSRIDTVTSNLTASGQIFDARTTALSGNLVTTGQTLFNQSQNNATNLSGSLTASGQRLSAVTVTGSPILNTPDFTGIKGVSVSITGLNRIVFSGNSDNLTQTGVILLGLISAASAGVSSINGTSGVLSVVGAGNVSVTTVAQTITISGNTGAYASFATKDQLTATGGLLSALRITGSSVILNPDLTGVKGITPFQSGNNIVLLSGQADHLTNTGVILGARVDTVSSNLTATGQILDARTVAISGNLTQTGVTLVAANLTLSGALVLKLTNTGVVLGNRIDAVTTNLTSTGQIFDVRTNIISGNLIQTGITLGILVTTVANNTQANALNLSGSLTATGQRLSAVSVTGSNVVSEFTLSGIGGTLVILSGTRFVLISGAGGGGGGITSSQLEATGQAAWNAADNNARNLSGSLTISGQTILGLVNNNYLQKTGNSNAIISGSLILGSGNITSGAYSMAQGQLAYAINLADHAQGFNTRAAGTWSHAEGYNSIAGAPAYLATGVALGVITFPARYGNITPQFYVGDSLLLNDTQYANFAGAIISTVTARSYDGTNTRVTISAGNTINDVSGFALIANFTTGINNWSGDMIMGGASHAEGNGIALGFASHAEGGSATPSFANTPSYAIGDGSHAEGRATKAIGYGSHSEGEGTEAIGIISHAEGHDTRAVGLNSHTEGHGTIASGIGSHAEGFFSVVLQNYGHAEGFITTAAATYSHAEGAGTIADTSFSHAQGLYNRTGVSGLFQVGRGLSNNREDVIYVSNIASNASILSGDWLNNSTGTDSLTIINLARLSAVSGALQSQIVGGGGTLVSITGSSTLSSANFTGVGNITVIQDGNTVKISTIEATGLMLQGITTTVPTGASSIFIPYGQAFTSLPAVVASVSITGNIAPSVTIKNPTITGYTAVLSAVTTEPGLVINTLAQQTGIAGSNDSPTIWSNLQGTGILLVFEDIPKNHTITLNGNTTFNGTGYALGREMSLFIRGDTILTSLSFPSGWTWLEGQPSSLASGKAMRVDMTCTTNTTSGVFAAYGVQT